MFNTKLYTWSPVKLQEVLISARSRVANALRYGHAFSATLTQINKTQWESGVRLNAYQTEHLLSLIRYAIENVPYYKAFCAEHGLTSCDFRGIEDLNKLPLITKTVVRDNLGSFLAPQRTHVIFKATTSGTTGSPLTVYYDGRTISTEAAFTTRHVQWTGFREGERRVWLRGDMIVPYIQEAPPFWRFNYTENMLMMSSYHISERTAPVYIKTIEDFDPSLIHAYPSSVGYLAKYLSYKGRHYGSNRLKAIHTSSETLPKQQRALIEDTFHAPVFDWYGNVEHVACIGTCEKANYHINSEYSYLEFLPLDDDRYEIVGTGFHNRLMPLIRYRTNDIVTFHESDIACGCGRGLPIVKEIFGRQDDYIKTPDGRMISRVTRIFSGIDSIVEGQIRQDDPNEITLVIVPRSNFSPKDRKKLLGNARMRLGKQMKIRIEPVSKIQRTGRGKFRTVVCNV